MSKSLNHMFNPFFYAGNPQLLAYENAWIDYIKNDVVPLDTIISRDQCRIAGFKKQEGLPDVRRAELRQKISGVDIFCSADITTDTGVYDAFPSCIGSSILDKEWMDKYRPRTRI